MAEKRADQGTLCEARHRVSSAASFPAPGAALGHTALAERMGLHVQVVNGIVQGRRAVTAKTALLLAKALDTTPQFWLKLQNACDSWEAERELAGKARSR